jgi:glyoxylase-like metal-dependent hydrolase (beta-lactamase superfamily II)
MEVKVLSVGQLATNCYLAYDASEGVIIDPADEADFIAETVQKLGFKPKAIISTHGHFDHNLAAGELQMIFGAPFLIHKKDKFLFDKNNDSASHWLKREINHIKPQKIEFLKQGDIVEFGKSRLKILESPGHTPGSICLLAESDPQVLFSGDLIFKGAIGRHDFSYSDKEELKKSLAKIFELPDNVVIYPGHGGETTIKNERKI